MGDSERKHEIPPDLYYGYAGDPPKYGPVVGILFIGIILLAMFAGCATVTTTAKSADGWTVTQDAKAVGKAGIDKVSQGLDGSVDITKPDGSTVKVKMNSQASGEGIASDNAFGQMAAQFFAWILAQSGKAAAGGIP